MTALACLALAAAALCWPRPIAERAERSDDAGGTGGTGGTGTADAGTGPRSLLARVRRALPFTGGSAARDEADLLGLVDGLAAALEAGLAPAQALDSAARGLSAAPAAGDVTRLRQALPGLLLRARTGDGLGAAWHELAREPGLEELLLVARAWSLSERTGAPLAHAARTAARLVRTGRDQRRRAATAVAGARATMTILTLLPLGGPVLAAVMGIDLVQLYATSPLVWACLAAGLGLVAVGRWWVRRLLVTTLRGPVLT